MLFLRWSAWDSGSCSSRNSFLSSPECIYLPALFRYVLTPLQLCWYPSQGSPNKGSHGRREHTAGIPTKELQLFLPRPLKKPLIKDVFLKAAPFAEPLQPLTVPCCPLHPQQPLQTPYPALPPKTFTLNFPHHCCTHKTLAVSAHAVPGQVPYAQATA